MSKISQIKVIQIAHRDGVGCLYCNSKIINVLTIDHIVPRDRGGSNNIKNLAFACKQCNSVKSNMLLTEFIKKYDVEITQKIAKFL